ncbi:MAG: tripartite tricarboxylate transporter permease, partial [Betaproteobacteria bacterium]|nr:tripartite tricarboxylate transporter permease [Betaproteobacteria bacterium]
MEEINSLMHGFSVALTLPNIGFMLIGIFLGVLIGVLPGLGGANGVAILLPLTFTMPPTSAIIMLSCIYWGALFGGAITSILFNIPGEPWSVATTFDGYPMAQKGRAGQALTAAFTSSFVGALFAVLLITFLSPLVAKFALQFGPAEFFGVYLLTFCAFIGMSKEPPVKTLASMMLGFALAAVGLDTVTGTLRMTFGSTELLNGFDFLTAVIGTAAHAAGTSALLPMLTLGIPGSPTAAVLLGGLLIWGLQPGPMLFVEQKDFVWGLIASMYLGNLVGLFVVLTTVPWWAAILRIPFTIIGPIIIVICAVGAYTVNNAMIDVVLMLVFGLLGYLFKKLEYPLAPLVLALVLGKSAESSFRQAMLLSDG